MCDPPRIYPSLPEYTSLFNKFTCVTVPESTPPSQNIPLPPPFATDVYVQPSQNLPLPPRIHPPFSKNSYVRPSQNLPLRPRIYPPFQQICMCDRPRIYPSLPEYTPPPPFNKGICATLPESTPPSQNTPPLSGNLYVRPSQNLPLPPRTPSPHPSQQMYMCNPPRIYPYFPEYTPFFNKFICATLPESTPPSQNIPPFQQMYMCDPPRMYPSLPEYTPLFSTN